MGCHCLLQGIFLIQGFNPRLLRLLRWQLGSLPLTATQTVNGGTEIWTHDFDWTQRNSFNQCQPWPLLPKFNGCRLCFLMCGTQALIRVLTTLHELKDSAVKVLRKLYRWERCRVRVEGPKYPSWILLVKLTGLANETGSDTTSEPEEFGHVIHSVFLKCWMMLLPSESLGSMNSTFSWSRVFFFFSCWP